jgi:transcriptional regulator of arginine metabolism
MRKHERQQLTESLIKQKSLSTQEDLVAALKKFGCQVTQATVSRDMRELGVRKATDRNGKTREVLARVLLESESEIRQAQNLVVVRSEPGTAPNLGRAIDEIDHSDIIGTVAGDDTVLLVLSGSGQAKKITKYLKKLTEVQG